MKNDRESLSFGRYLQAIRLEKKISLEQVSEQTRIGLGNLMLVEQEDFTQLPAAVFVKGFLRAYADAVGADGDEAVRRFLSRRDVVQKIAESEAAVGKPAARLGWKLFFSVFLLLCIIALSIAVISYLGERSGSDKAHQPAPSTAPEQPKAAGAQGGADLAGAPSQATPKKMRLQITALTNTWVKVIVDEKDSKEYNLNSGDKIELEAVSGYNLLIGDAGGIKISLNEKPVPIPGESGQVVTMHLP